MKTLRLAWRQLRRDLVAGEVRILLAALVLAVVAVTSVGFVTNRTERALAIEANRLLGGDVVVRSDTPITGVILDAAQANGLHSTQTTELDTMIRVGEGDDTQLRLGDLRALGEGFPLRGSFTLIEANTPTEHAVHTIPAPGTLWMTRAGAETLGAQLGDRVSIGDSTFTLVALVTQEPDAALDYFNIAPKVLINASDLPATGLIQLGSRIGYRLVVAGDASAVEQFTATARGALARGQRLETIQDARPEVRSALDRASRFLGLSALMSVILAAIAVAMAARRHSERHLSGVAVMRCLGAQQSRLVGIHVGELLLLDLMACTLGILIAFVLQWGVGAWLAQTLKVDIPPASWTPALQGYGVGLLVLLAFGAPPVLALRRVPALRVLRRDLDPTEPSALLVALAGFAGLGALLWWQAGSATLGLTVLLGIAATLAVLAALAWLLIWAIRRLRGQLRGALRYGLANVSRRASTSVAQISALGLGLMALLLLTFVRTDLLDRWKLALQDNAPNRFIINVQDDQVQPVEDFIKQQGLDAPTLFPMVRGRLTTHNGAPVVGSDYQDATARRRAEREFNLSTVATLRDDNNIIEGKFWAASPTPTPELSVEELFAEQLGWKIGDIIGFDLAGQTLEAKITSLRSINWESFQPNFFVLVSLGVLRDYPASHVTAVNVPASHSRFTAELVQAFPNLSVVDIDQVLNQVRSTADQVSTVVQVVFWFSLAAGLLVLMAAVSASQDERLLEGGVMRVLGGSRRQLRAAQASEFAAIGLIAGLVAAIAAVVMSAVITVQVFDLPWEPTWQLALVGGISGLVGILAALLAGMFATRKVLDAPPSVTLRELQG